MNDIQAQAQAPAGSTDAQLVEINCGFYDALWADVRFVEPQRFNTWPLVASLLPQTRTRLEVAPGLRPRLPIEGTHFVDISRSALAQLRVRGANAILSSVSSLPFPDRTFDLVCALDIIDHVDDDDRALFELARVAAPGASLLLSAPLHESRWTPFDEFVGHRRRYQPERLFAKLARHHLLIERSAIFGMRPRSSRLLDLGMWFLTHQRKRAMWWYNRLMMPLAVRFANELVFSDGIMDTEGVDELLLVCRKARGDV